MLTPTSSRSNTFSDLYTISLELSRYAQPANVRRTNRVRRAGSAKAAPDCTASHSYDLLDFAFAGQTATSSRDATTGMLTSAFLKASMVFTLYNAPWHGMARGGTPAATSLAINVSKTSAGRVKGCAAEFPACPSAHAHVHVSRVYLSKASPPRQILEGWCALLPETDLSNMSWLRHM